MAAPEDFTRLVIWQRAQQLAADVAAVVSELPRDRAAQTIGGQVMRSAGSVPANIAEGYGRCSQPAYRHHLSIARGSLFETHSWIDLLQRSGFVDERKVTELFGECSAVDKLLTMGMKSLAGAGVSYAREEGDGYYADF